MNNTSVKYFMSLTVPRSQPLSGMSGAGVEVDGALQNNGMEEVEDEI